MIDAYFKIICLACMINASIGLRVENINYRVFWVIDGLLKFCIGIWMLLLTYNF